MKGKTAGVTQRLGELGRLEIRRQTIGVKPEEVF